jgi:hypothetical protein
MTPTETPVVAAAAAPVVDAAAFQAQIDTLKEQVAESNRTAKFWADKAAAGKSAPAAAAEPEDDTDVLEAITTGGAKGFDNLASKRGFVKLEQVEELINTRAQSLTKEQELIQRYPDLSKKTSDFFKATADQYGILVKAGTPQHVAMELAAERAELNLMREGKIKPPGADTAPTKEEKETARLARIAAQSSGGGRRPAAAAEDEGDEELTPQQKNMCDQMGVSYESYAKRAKAGVSIKGR